MLVDLSCVLPMMQSALFNGFAFDPFSLRQNGVVIPPQINGLQK
jgi:hypothetical protein